MSETVHYKGTLTEVYRLEEIEKSLLRSFPRKFVEIYNETNYSFINNLKESLK